MSTGGCQYWHHWSTFLFDSLASNPKAAILQALFSVRLVDLFVLRNEPEISLGFSVLMGYLVLFGSNFSVFLDQSNST